MIDIWHSFNKNFGFYTININRLEMRQVIKPGTTYAMNETVAISGRFNSLESLSGKMAQEGHGFNLCLSEITNSRDMTSDRCFLTSSEMSVLHASHVLWPIPRWWLNPTMKNLVWDHSDYKFWNPYMWSMPLDRCSPAFSVRDNNFQKVTNWSALVPEISSEQRDLWPFWLLSVA